MEQPTTGIKQFVPLVGDADGTSEVAVGAEKVDDKVGEVVYIDGYITNTRIAKHANLVLQ